MPSYYDIDDILAEEEVVPCTTLFDFDHLSHLDPDYSHFQHRESQARKRKAPSQHAAEQPPSQRHVLPGGHRIKVPLWAAERWSSLGFVRLGLPSMYGRRARECLAADPASTDLRMKSERYYMAGSRLVDLVDQCSKVIGRRSRGGNRIWRREHAAAMDKVQREAKELRQTLLKTYTGQRLRRTLDWTLGSIDDDVSSYTCRLTEMERRLFALGAEASRAYQEWKQYGSRRIAVSRSGSVVSRNMYVAPAAAAVTPDPLDPAEASRTKRVRTA